MAKPHTIGPTSSTFMKGLMSKIKVKLPKTKNIKLKFKGMK